jgi:N-acetylglucosamine kinase-like BadF-type ATPase
MSVRRHPDQRPDSTWQQDPGDADDLLLGVDGGGTKTEAWLAARRSGCEPLVVGRGVGGPANPRAAGLPVARSNVEAAVREAFAAADRPVAPAAAACLAVAGVGHEPLRQAMEDWGRQQQLARRVRVVHDGEAVLRAGTPRNCGVALVAGTGSFAFGMTEAGTRQRAGGWGYLFGDEGGGYAIGIAGLRAVVRAADGREPSTALTSAILGALKLTHPPDLIPALCGPTPARQQIAALAPYVLQAASDGDAAARSIVLDAAQELAELVVAVARKLAFARHHYSLALAGGVVVGHPPLQHEIINRLQTLYFEPDSTRAVPHPAHGALLLANEMACG